MDVHISTSLIAALVTAAAKAHPDEACGLLLGEGANITAVQPARNVHATPQTHFAIDPQSLIDAHRAARDGGPQVLGYYHSHPNGRIEPSATDRAMSSGTGEIWAIVAASDIRFWRDDKTRFTPLSFAAHPS